ncbi:hypothetical protein [Clostridium sp. ZS2-4]|nr:hypothetical protein [Clostridium sp. ZS2-4]MCY6354349.1 hypothetical protein [Clostridium sp. ZS2-4]
MVSILISFLLPTKAPTSPTIAAPAIAPATELPPPLTSDHLVVKKT